MTLTPLQKRALRRSRHTTMVDMNLVSLIDVFTILIFFLLSSAGVEAALPGNKAVKLPLSTASTAPRETRVVVVSSEEIIVDGRKVAAVADALAQPGDVIAGLQVALQAQQQPAAAAGPHDANAGAAKALTIVGDKSIPYRLLRKVMFTGAQAGFADVSFAVQRKSTL